MKTVQEIQDQINNHYDQIKILTTEQNNIIRAQSNQECMDLVKSGDAQIIEVMHKQTDTDSEAYKVFWLLNPTINTYDVLLSPSVFEVTYQFNEHPDMYGHDLSDIRLETNNRSFPLKHYKMRNLIPSEELNDHYQGVIKGQLQRMKARYELAISNIESIL